MGWNPLASISFHVRNDSPPTLEYDQTLPSQALEGSVDVHRRKTQGVAEVGLCKRDVEGIAVRPPHGLQSHPQFGKQVSDTSERIALPDVDDPFPKRSFVGQGRPLQSASGARAALQNVNHMIAWDGSDPGVAQQADRMIHAPQHEDVNVAQVAGQQVRHDLPTTVREYLVPTRPTFEEEEHNVRCVTLLDEIGACFVPANIAA